MTSSSVSTDPQRSRRRVFVSSLLTLIVILVGVSVYLAWSSSRGIATVAGQLPTMLLSADSAASRTLPLGSSVILDGRKIAVLSSARRIGYGDSAITIYTGQWEPSALNLPVRADTTLAARLRGADGSAAGVTIELIPRPAHSQRPRGAVWLDPSPGVFVIY
jgi:hypothetical protein